MINRSRMSEGRQVKGQVGSYVNEGKDSFLKVVYDRINAPAAAASTL